MSHQVGGMLDLPHGVINGILLPHVIRFNSTTDAAPFVAIAAALSLPEQRGTPEEAALAVADRVERLAREVGVPKGGLGGELGVREEDLSRLASFALLDACMSTNPREATQEQMVALFRGAL